MKKCTFARKKWLDIHSKRTLKKRSAQRRLQRQHGLNEFRRNNAIHQERMKRQYLYGQDIVKNTPRVFSFKHNIEETSSFFDDIIKTRDEASEYTSIYIDSGNVEKLGVDALMYLIAIMDDTYSYDEKKVIFKGNVPQNKEALDIFDKSGFTKYVRYRSDKIIPRTNNIQICDGKTQNSEKAKEICKYVHENSSLTRIDTMPLYELIVELMNNTVHHAYGEQHNAEYSKNSWYMFSERRDNKIVFVFLDTGLGIPTTVYKKWHEKINPYAKDSEFIKTALSGVLRTETQKKNRGKGLPQILKNCQRGLITNAFIYSGNGYCKINKKNTSLDAVEAYDVKNKIYGTLFSWEIII